jgi:Fic family protein
MDGLMEKPGAYRKKPVWILGSTFDPPNWQEVPALMSDLCRYVNGNWRHRDVVNLCAFIIWRFGWIQPFFDGNGRIARAVAHTVFCIRHRGFLPSQRSLLEQIPDNRKLYVSNLESAHRIFLQTRNIDEALRPIERWLRDLLSQQSEAASSF